MEIPPSRLEGGGAEADMSKQLADEAFWLALANCRCPAMFLARRRPRANFGIRETGACRKLV